MASAVALMTSRNRVASSAHCAGGDADFCCLQGIDRVAPGNAIARHAELIRLERHAIRQLGKHGDKLRRAEHRHDFASWVQSLPRIDDSGTASSCQVDLRASERYIASCGVLGIIKAGVGGRLRRPRLSDEHLFLGVLRCSQSNLCLEVPSSASGSGSGRRRISCDHRPDRLRLAGTSLSLILSRKAGSRHARAVASGSRPIRPSSVSAVVCVGTAGPRPDARSKEFTNWPREKYDSFFRAVIREVRAGTSSWNL